MSARDFLKDSGRLLGFVRDRVDGFGLPSDVEIESAKSDLIREFHDSEKDIWLQVFKFKVEYVVDGEKRTKEYIARQTNSDRGVNSYNRFKLVREAGFDEEPFLVPETYSFFPEEQVWVRESVSGPTIWDLLSGDGSELIDAAAMAGRWLKKFHGTKLHEDVTKEIRPWRGFDPTPDIANRVPELAEQSKALAEETEKLAADLLLDRVVTETHGDFHPNNIFWLEGSVSVIDFEDAAMANPMIDVAHFVEQVGFTMRKLGKGSEAKKVNASFLEGYFGADEVDEKSTRAIALYRADLKAKIISKILHGDSDKEIIKKSVAAVLNSIEKLHNRIKEK